jgi:hypothetical protein
VYRQSLARNTTVSYWKPEVSVKLVSDFTNYPVSHGKILTEQFRPTFTNISSTSLVPPGIARNLVTHDHPKTSADNKKKSSLKDSGVKKLYKPSLFVDEIGLTTDKYIYLNNTVNQLPLKISIGPMSSQVPSTQLRYLSHHFFSTDFLLLYFTAIFVNVSIRTIFKQPEIVWIH